MKSFDISPKFWGAHSTRGAGVAFYRRLGLSAEEVCEIGKWKDVNAFTTHYQRLDAHHKASEGIHNLVHNTSQWGSAEPKGSRTPRKTWFERGGRDSFGEAQSHCEVLSICPACHVVFLFLGLLGLFLLSFLPALADLNCPVDLIYKIMSSLLNPESMEFGERWSDLFFNVDGVCSLLSHTKDPATGGLLLGAGANWNGVGWTTGRASRAVYGATGVAMVDENLKDYLESFLFALSLAYNIDIPKLQLKAQAATVALKFAERVQQRDELQQRDAQRLSQRTPGTCIGNDEETGQKEKLDEAKDGKEPLELEPLPWEAQKEELPEDFQLVMQRHLKGSLQLDARALLEQMPVWKGVKERSETNNHRQDSMDKHDRILKGLQQKVLGLQRIYPLLHGTIGDEEAVQLGQMFFGLLLQFEDSILTERKKASIPGSLQQDNVLFTQEDIRIEKRKMEVNRASGMFPPPERRFYFQIGSGPKSFRWKGSFGGKGYASGWKGGRGPPYKGRGGAYPSWRPKPFGKYAGSAIKARTHSGQQNSKRIHSDLCKLTPPTFQLQK